MRDELNVHDIRWAERRADYVHHEVKPVFPKTGPRFGKRMKEVAAALAAADGDELAAALERDGEVTIELLRSGGGPVDLSSEEVEMRLVEREGIAAQGDRELLVALDTALTPELVAEGLAREVVNRIQTARKEADLDYADRIRVRYQRRRRAGARRSTPTATGSPARPWRVDARSRPLDEPTRAAARSDERSSIATADRT